MLDDISELNRLSSCKTLCFQTLLVSSSESLLVMHAQVIIIIYRRFNVIIHFIYLACYVTFNTVQVISRQVVGRAEETSTYS